MPPGNFMIRCLPPMHELSVCRSLIAQVEAVAIQHGARAVRSIRICVGPLSGIDPDLLQRTYPLARAGTVADTAGLIIEHLPIRVRCERCGFESEAAPNRLICTRCGDWHTRLLSGDEMLLASVELETDDGLSASPDQARIP